MKELVSDNEDAYRAINRQNPRPGKSSARPAHLRRFYIALQIVGEFWDTSLDGPAHASDNVTNADSSPDGKVISDKLAPSSTQSIDTDTEHQLSIKHNNPDIAVSQLVESEEPRSRATSKTFAAPISQSTVPSSVSPKISANSAVASCNVAQDNYAGRRTSTGTMMPAQYRDNLLKEFLEPMLWAFGCRYEMPRIQPHLHVRSLRIPVDLSGVVYCTPKERPSSMVGSLEGPLLGIQGRHVTTFGEEDGRSDLVDLLREVGAMLLIAQERSRQGTHEVIPNQGKWFITKPRWGGGTGEAMGEPLGLACAEEVVSQQKKHDEEPPTKKRSREKRVRVEMTREAARKENLRKSTMPPSSRWDSRIKYMRVGKDAESEFDNKMSNKSDTFSFLYLPPEIRNRIYRLLFYLPSRGVQCVLYPTALPTVKERKDMYLSSGLGLLRVCMSVHAEATALLYSHIAFAFSDEPSDLYNPTNKISHCGINLMYKFLQIIGFRNRGLLRYIRIKLSNPRYLYYDDEVVPGFDQAPNGGKYLGDAFELLSHNHSLRKITLILRTSTVHETGDLPSLLHHLLRPGQDSRLLQQLNKIRGKVDLRIKDHPSPHPELEIPEELQILCGKLKSLLALPKEIKLVPEEILHIENGKQDIVQKVLSAFKRYSDLVQQIKAEEKQLKD
ncbi:hypothetical protein MMC27_004127 [Xylographa pallens]|nr:hypothetical protein [Xylographa pallens]